MSMHNLLSVFAFVATGATVVCAQGQATAQVLTSKPGMAAPMPKDFLGVSIETTSWTAWAGSTRGQPNTFVQQALANLQSMTNQPLPIRVGGGTQEHLVYDQNAHPVNVYPGGSVQRSLGVSSDFFTLAGNFPRGTPFTFGLNFGLLNTTEMTLQAGALADAFQGQGRQSTKGVQLELVELGNEDDFLPIKFFFPDGPSSYDVLQYVDQYTQYVKAITKVIDFDGAKKPKLQIGDFANAIGGGPGFEFPELFLYWSTAVLNSPLFQSRYAKYITTFTAHHYDTSYITNPPVGSLFRRAAIRGNVSVACNGQSQAINAGLQFHLGETNSIAQSGSPGISNTAEGALFVIDYALQLASRNVPRAHFHQGNGSAYNFIQATPVAAGSGIRVPSDKARVYAGYYGAVVVQDFIGSEPNTYIAELGVSQPNIGGYALYAGNQLKRVLLLNYDSYFSGDASARRSTTVKLRGLDGKSGTVTRLYTPYTNSVDGLLYGGLSFDTDTGKPVGKRDTSSFSGGSITTNAAEALIIKLN